MSLILRGVFSFMVVWDILFQRNIYISIMTYFKRSYCFRLLPCFMGPTRLFLQWVLFVRHSSIWYTFCMQNISREIEGLNFNRKYTYSYLKNLNKYQKKKPVTWLVLRDSDSFQMANLLGYRLIAVVHKNMETKTKKLSKNGPFSSDQVGSITLDSQI